MKNNHNNREAENEIVNEYIYFGLPEAKLHFQRFRYASRLGRDRYSCDYDI